MIYASGMRQWSFSKSAVVNATPESVAAWWFDTERANEYRARVERSGPKNLSYRTSTNDGTRLTAIQWKDRRGWEFHQQHETFLGSNGEPARNGDAFTAPSKDVITYNPPIGRTLTLTCLARQEFIPKGDDGTEIRVVHDHTMVGGSRLLGFQRSMLASSEQKATERFFDELIEKCQAALGRGTAS